MFKDILVPVKATRGSEKAIQVACELAGQLDAELHIITGLNCLYQMPTVLLGTVVNGKPNFTTIAHVDIMNAGKPNYISISSWKGHYSILVSKKKVCSASTYLRTWLKKLITAVSLAEKR